MGNRTKKSKSAAAARLVTFQDMLFSHSPLPKQYATKYKVADTIGNIVFIGTR